MGKVSSIAKGGGGLGVAGAGIFGVLLAEAKMARNKIGNATKQVHDATGWYGRDNEGPELRIALLGDSSAAGYGVDKVEETPGAVLASGVAEQSGRPVYLRSYAVVGARSSQLDGQAGLALHIKPHVAIILIGANDVTHVMTPARSVGYLAAVVKRLQESGTEVVVGTCPDLGTVRPILQPLKQVARTWSRRLAAAQTIGVLEAGGRTVSLAAILGQEFRDFPHVFFGPDQFHPSVEGYRSLAQVLLPSTLAALGLVPDEEAAVEPARGEGVMPLASAAAQAVETAGTELDGTEVAGSRAGVRGLWVTLRHRRRRPVESQAPTLR
ncbi:SGNH/GDSL hydrolase family protein [Nocardioides sp.]|uniref:SGNH/GDSL hydrolase family protein n=1 Tax=Nocardioides sp. TaxID=35761 RepID=UPI0039E28E6D